MEMMKQHLIDETKRQIETVEKEIAESGREIKMLEAKLKVENKFSEMLDLKEDLEEDVKYSLIALRDMLMMEQNRNAELKKEIEILRYKGQVIRKFEEEEL